MEGQRAFLSAVSAERQKSWRKAIPSVFLSLNQSILSFDFMHNFIEFSFRRLKLAKYGYAE